MDTETWALIYPHQHRLLRIARRRVPTAEDAEDCVQEAMLRCARYPALDRTRVAPLLTAITERVCADWHRRAARERRALPRYAVPATWNGGVDEATLRLDRPWLVDQLDALSPTERAVLLARAADQTPREAAERARVSYAAAASALTRARAKMRRAWHRAEDARRSAPSDGPWR